MNRKARRAQSALLRKDMHTRAKGKKHPCDWPLCKKEWEFVTLAPSPGKYKQVIARRCRDHRIAEES